MPAAGSGSGLAGLELEAGKKSGLDTSKTLRGESAIALRYC